MGNRDELLGAELTVVRRHDVEGDHNRGWRADLLELLVNGQRAGYLRATFIPGDRWKQRYLDHPGGPLIPWLDHIEGGPFQGDRSDETMWAEIRQRFSIPEKIPRPKFESWLARHRGKDIQVFTDYFVDKPLVDYIRLYSEDEDTERVFPRNCRDSFERRPLRQGFQRLGLGRFLYEEMSTWLSESGLKLYASSLQSPEAAVAWERLASIHPQAIGQEEVRISERQRREHNLALARGEADDPDPRRKRIFLDGAKLSPFQHPGWVGSVRRFELPGEQAAEDIDCEMTSTPAYR